MNSRRERKKWPTLQISQVTLLWLQIQLLISQDNLYIYDDIELTDKTSTVDLSKNVAYVSTKK